MANYNFNFQTGRVTMKSDSEQEDNMPMTNLQNCAIEIVKARNGMKASDLFARLVVEFINLPTEVIGSLVGNLVEKGELVAVNYGPTASEFTFFMPRGFEAKVLNNGEYIIN